MVSLLDAKENVWLPDFSCSPMASPPQDSSVAQPHASGIKGSTFCDTSGRPALPLAPCGSSQAVLTGSLVNNCAVGRASPSSPADAPATAASISGNWSAATRIALFNVTQRS